MQQSATRAEQLEIMDDAEQDIASEKEGMIASVRKSIRENVERTLGSKPELQKKFNRFVRRRRKKQQSISYSSPCDPSIAQTIAVAGTKTNHTHEPDSLCEPSTNRTGNTAAVGASPSGVIDNERTESFSAAEDATDSTSTDEVFDTVGNSLLTDSSASHVVRPVTKTIREDQSFLDLLKKPIEEEGTSSPQPASLQSTLHDDKDKPDFVNDDMGDGDLFESSLSGSPRHLADSDSFGTPGIRSTLLLDLLDGDEVATDAAVETPGQYPTISQWSNGPSIPPESLQTPNEPCSSLLDLLNDDDAAAELDHGQNTVDRQGHAPPLSATKPHDACGEQPDSLLDLLDDEVESETDWNAADQHSVSSQRIGQSRVQEWNHVWSNDEILACDMKSHFDAPIDAIDQGLALLLVMTDHDWSHLDASIEDEDVRFFEAASEEDFVVESDCEEEMLITSEEETEEANDEESNESIIGTARELLEEASYGEMFLSSSDYNALLLQLAVSRLPVDDAVAMMLRVYQHMSELGQSGANCAPDATTFLILMVTLDRRANAPMSSADMCRQMIDANIELTSDALAQGLQCLRGRNGIKDTERLIDKVRKNKTGHVAVPQWALVRLLDMYKSENMQFEALDLIQKCIENDESNARSVTNLVLRGISWPRRDRRRSRLDRSSYLTHILDTLESCSSSEEGTIVEAEDAPLRQTNSDECLDIVEEVCLRRKKMRISSYKPPYKVWRHLILALAAEVDTKTNAGWEVVHKAFKSMRIATEDCYWPDTILLKTGLAVAEVFGDAELAVDLVLKLQDRQLHETLQADEFISLRSDGAIGIGSDTGFDIKQEEGEHPAFLEGSGTEESSNDVDWSGNTRPSTVVVESGSIRVPVQAFVSAMRVCIAASDSVSSERLLEGIRDTRNRIPRSIKRELFCHALKGFAMVGNSDAAQNLLKEMLDGELKPNEEAYGIVIYSLAVANKTKEACELFKKIRSGHFNDGIAPGVTCYDARMLAHIEAHEWENALECHSERKEAGLAWSSANFQDVLLALFRLGRKEEALETIEEALESGLNIDYGCCDLSMAILLGDVLNSRSIDETRMRLRELGEQNKDLKEATLNLSRALRSAEVEQKRQPTQSLKLNEISSKRELAWREALQHVVNLNRAIQKARVSSTSFSN